MSLRLEQVQQIAEFRFALRRCERTAELAAQRAGLTPRQYMLLLALEGSPDGNGRETIGDLADRLQLAQSTITGLVDRAEAAGLVRREPGPTDGRVVAVAVTPAGSARLERALAVLAEDRDAVAGATAALRPYVCTA